MRIRSDSVDEGTDWPEEAVERYIDQTEQVIDTYKHVRANLVRDVYSEVEKLSRAAADIPVGPRRHEDRREHRFEERIEALFAELPARVAELVVQELAKPQVRAVLNQLVDAKLRAVTEAIARMTTNPPPVQNIRNAASRRRR